MPEAREPESKKPDIEATCSPAKTNSARARVYDEMFAEVAQLRQCLVYVWVDDISANRRIAVYGGYYHKAGVTAC